MSKPGGVNSQIKTGEKPKEGSQATETTSTGTTWEKPKDLSQWNGRDPTDKTHKDYDPLQDPTAKGYDPRSDTSRKDYDPAKDPNPNKKDTGQQSDGDVVSEDGLTTEQWVQEQMMMMGMGGRPEQLPPDIQAFFEMEPIQV